MDHIPVDPRILGRSAWATLDLRGETPRAWYGFGPHGAPVLVVARDPHDVARDIPAQYALNLVRGDAVSDTATSRGVIGEATEPRLPTAGQAVVRILSTGVDALFVPALVGNTGWTAWVQPVGAPQDLPASVAPIRPGEYLPIKEWAEALLKG